MINVNGVEIKATIAMARDADLAECSHPLQRAMLESVDERPGMRWHHETVARKCTAAVHVRALLEAEDEAAERFFTDPA